MSPIAISLSLLGLIPFVVFAFGAVGHIPETAERMLIALIDYAGLFLAFGGGILWGSATVSNAARPLLRFGAGVLPLIVAWVGLVLAQLVAPSVALAVLSVGYLATVLTERRIAQQLQIPPRYGWLRRLFSVVAIALMAVVMVLRGLGQTIVF